jgi:CBS domain containing-hemolysin-like protein
VVIAVLKVLVLVLMVGVSIYLAAVEAGFYLLKRRRLSHVAHQNRRAEIVNRYLMDPPTLLMPVHIGTYTAHVIMTVTVTSLLLDLMDHHDWALIVSFGVMLVYLLVFRLTTPYALVRRNPERSLLVLLPAFDLYARALAPLVAALRKRAAGQPADADEITAVPDVPPPPVHDADEERLLDAVNRFAQTLVRDVMTPRPDIVAVPASGTVADLKAAMRETKYSRIPVYGENLDDIVGVVTVRDLLEYEGQPGDPLQPLARPVFLVPETKKIAELLKEFQAGGMAFAVVIDEYGGTAGIVSVEDIVEEIVGEIKDEYDAEAEPISMEGDGSILVTGRVTVDRLEQALEAPLNEGEDVGTVGGLVASLFGHFPQAGERIDYRGFTVEVVDAEKKRVNRVRFRRKPAEAQAQ